MAATAAFPYGACCGLAMAIFLIDGFSKAFKPELTPVWNRSAPTPNLPDRVFDEGAGFGEAGGFKLPGIIPVGRKEHVEWRAVLQLLREVCRRSHRSTSRFFPIPAGERPDFLHGKLQIGRGSYCDLLRGAESGAQH